MRFFVFLLALFATTLACAQVPPAIAARVWLLIDATSAQVLAEKNADTRAEPASLTKLMTAYLVFNALRREDVKPNQPTTVSGKAAAAPGTRMFIEPGKPVTVNELLHGLIVQSGNDAAIALAELINGSEEAFVSRMNVEARRLDLAGTHYTNVTGLADPQQYTTARDLARLTQALIRDFPDDYALYAQKEYTYNRTTQLNRNRLLWLDPTIDGVKVSQTDIAGFCLVASAKRGTRRLIAVVLGADSDNLRVHEALRLLTYGFQNFESAQLYAKGQVISQVKIFKGSSDSVPAGFLDDFTISLPKDMANKVTVQLLSQQPLLAPVQQGQQIARLKVLLDGKEIGEYPVLALESVPIAGFFGRAWDNLMLWLQ
jgi:D-alanyl-D-alanine carboxypeptidase (penicillin-binding protein 5/6)